MPDLKISQLPVATTPLAGTELVPIVQGGVTDRTTVAAFLSAGLPVSATTLSASGAVTLSGGTANGVLYLNGSKVATSGSALTFDGTNFVVNTGSITSGNSTFAGSLVAVGGGSGATIAITPNTISGANGVVYNTSFVSGGAGPHVFQIGGSEQMRLTSTGLGIGTSSPAYKLDVSGTARADAFVGPNNLTSYMNLAQSNGLVVRGASGSPANQVELWTLGSAKAYLDSSGNLGLGVTPSAWSAGLPPVFQTAYGNINGSSTTQININQNSYLAGAGWTYLTNGAATMSRQEAGAFAWFTAPSGTAGNAISFTQAMTLDTNGNLGVGPTSPSAKLHVGTQSGGVAAPTQLRLDTSYASTATPTNQQLKLALAYISSTEAYGFALDNLSGIWYHSGNTTGPTGNHIFATGGTERARITSTGNVVAGGSVALATTATDGFLYVPTCAGTPTGTPTAITGMAPIVVDTTNNKLYFYSGGAWRDAGP